MQGVARWVLVFPGLLIASCFVGAEIPESGSEWMGGEDAENSREFVTANDAGNLTEGIKTARSKSRENETSSNVTSKENSEHLIKNARIVLPADKIAAGKSDLKVEESSTSFAEKWRVPGTNENPENSRKTSFVKFPVDRIIVTNLSEESNGEDDESSGESSGKSSETFSGSSSSSSGSSSESSGPSSSSSGSSSGSSGSSSASSGSPGSSTSSSASSSRPTSSFRPSVHLGEIVEPANPFNQLRHFELQGPRRYPRPRQHAVRVKFQEDPGRPENAPFVVVGERFQEENFPRIATTTSDQHGEFLGEEVPGSEADSRRPGPPSFHVTEAGNVLGYVYDHRHEHSPIFDRAPTLETIEKPTRPLVYLSEQESTFTRTRKFPYQYHQPYVEYVEEVQHPVLPYPPPPRSVSPWRRIIHLIGAFLPLGLLIAALTPNVVKVDNTTEPNIVLSKLRVVDLPAEHKIASQDESPAGECEARDLCRILLNADGQDATNRARNVLWNLVNRIPADAAKKNGLREIFQAVKKKDCTFVECKN